MQGIRKLVTALACALFLVPTGAGPVAASHQANCAEPADFNRWTGHEKRANLHGASGLFDGQSLDMCQNPEPTWERSGSFAFSNIVGPTSWDIVQTGVGRCRFPFIADCTWRMEVYATWGRQYSASSPACHDVMDRAPVVDAVAAYDGTANYYAVFHGANRWHFLLDGVEIGSSIHEESLCWPKQAAQWFAESLDIGDSLGGWETNKYRMRELAWTAAEAPADIGNWTYGNFNPGLACGIGPGMPDFQPPFRCDIVAGATIDIWTKR